MHKTLFFILFFIASTGFTSRCSEEICGMQALVGHELNIAFPMAPLARGSLQIVSRSNHQRFVDWTTAQHGESYDLLGRIVHAWKERKKADEYLVYGKTRLSDRAEMFRWDVVPFPKARNSFLERLQVMWRVSYGPKNLSPRDREKMREREHRLLGNLSSEIASSPLESPPVKGEDPFCDPSIITKQCIYEGNMMRVLFDYSRYRFLGDDPHFLIIPKEHKAVFTELTKEEYQEALTLAQKIACYFADLSPSYVIHLYHKNGHRAGQTVPHWHLHILVINAVCEPGATLLTNTVRSTGLLSPFQRLSDMTKKTYNNSRDFFSLIFPRERLSKEDLEEKTLYWRKQLTEVFR